MYKEWESPTFLKGGVTQQKQGFGRIVLMLSVQKRLKNGDRDAV